MKKKSNKKALILFIILVIVAAIVTIVRHELIKTKFNSSYVNGNTAGNLYNGGLFCESNGTIFFSNPNDKHKLYSMTADGSEITKICDDIASYINADDHYLYYVRDNGSQDSEFSFLKWNNNSLCRIKRDGSGDVTILDNDPCLYASLVGNYIYYLHYDQDTATTLYKVKIDGSERTSLASQSYFTCSTQDEYIYYNGLDLDHYIYQWNTKTDASSIIYKGNCWQPTVIDGTAYFMDCDDNYSLAKVYFGSGDKETLVTDRIDCYCIYGNYIYYQRNDSTNPALCRVMTDGTNFEEIASGNYTNINATGNYIYFFSFDNDTVCYRTPTNGAINVTMFTP